MREANSSEWLQRTDNWVVMQEKSRRFKAEADKLDKHGEERRDYLQLRRNRGAGPSPMSAEQGYSP